MFSAIDFESGPLPPASIFWMPIAKRARSDGVVHRPAAAISGYTWRFPATGLPSAEYPAAAAGTSAVGSGWSNVLSFIPRGPSTRRCRSAGNAVPVTSVIASCAIV